MDDARALRGMSSEVPAGPYTRADFERWASDTARFAAEWGALDLLAKAVAALQERDEPLDLKPRTA